MLLAFGNASAVDRARGVFAIKPSGIPCATVRPDQWSSWPSRTDASWRATCALVGRADPPAAVPGVAGHRRRRAHPLRCTRSAWAQAGRADPLPRHDPRRPLPGRRARDPGAHGCRDRRATTSGTPASPSRSCTAPAASTRPMRRGSWSGRTGRSCGARRGRGRPCMPRRSRPSRGWRSTPSSIDPAAAPIGDRCWRDTSTASMARPPTTASGPEVRS